MGYIGICQGNYVETKTNAPLKILRMHLLHYYQFFLNKHKIFTLAQRSPDHMQVLRKCYMEGIGTGWVVCNRPSELGAVWKVLPG